MPITLKAYPCKWNGCDKFGCCTVKKSFIDLRRSINFYIYSESVELTLVYEYDFNDRVVRYVDLMRAHAVRTAVGRPVISVAELFGWDIVDLRKQRCRWKRKGDLVDEGNYVISGRRD